MRALIVSKAFINRMYRQKLTELARLGVEVVAVTPDVWHEDGSVQPLERGGPEDFELKVLPLRWNGHFHVHSYPGLSALIRSVKPDIVHMDEEPYNLATFLGLSAARRQRIPSLFFTWQNLLRRYPFPFRDMERAAYRWSRGAIAGGAEAAGVLRSKGYGGPIRVVPQFGVDPDTFYPVERDGQCFTVGLLNRLTRPKAPLVALRAFASLPDDARLRIIGDGLLRNEVIAEIDRLRLTDRVELRQRVPSTDVPDIMRSLDALVLPSLTTPSWKEQFGRVLIEGMACGVPVIGSDSGEIPHVIGDAGIVVPEGDVGPLRDALRSLYDDPSLRIALASRGRDRILAHFTHRRVAEATLAAYRDFLAI